MGTKRCTKCGATKEISDFFKDKRSTDALRQPCKTCISKRSKEQKYREEAIKRFHDEGVTRYAVLSEDILSTTKECSHCGLVKEQRDFYFRKSENNFWSYCKSCHKSKERENRKNLKLKKIRMGGL